MTNPTIDVNIIKSFLVSTKNVLETMCNTTAKADKPKLKDDTLTYGEVTGIIGMASEDFTGCMVVSFSRNCILNIVASMFMETVKEEINDEIIDAVGELTNMICGGAKRELAKANHKFDLATPTMIVGTGVEISYHSNAPTILIPFTTEFGKFVVETNLGIAQIVEGGIQT
ncbi:MAG: chemotaxis protein CheX [Desulfurivibrionaceae bacterium]